MTTEVVFRSAAWILLALTEKYSGMRIPPLRSAPSDPMPVAGLISGTLDKAQTRQSARA